MKPGLGHRLELLLNGWQLFGNHVLKFR